MPRLVGYTHVTTSPHLTVHHTEAESFNNRRFKFGSYRTIIVMRVNIPVMDLKRGKGMILSVN